MGGRVQKYDVTKPDILFVEKGAGDKARHWPAVVRRRLRITLGGWGFHAVFEKENDVQS